MNVLFFFFGLIVGFFFIFSAGSGRRWCCEQELKIGAVPVGLFVSKLVVLSKCLLFFVSFATCTLYAVAFFDEKKQDNRVILSGSKEADEFDDNVNMSSLAVDASYVMSINFDKKQSNVLISEEYVFNTDLSVCMSIYSLAHDSARFDDMPATWNSLLTLTREQFQSLSSSLVSDSVQFSKDMACSENVNKIDSTIIQLLAKAGYILSNYTFTRASIESGFVYIVDVEKKISFAVDRKDRRMYKVKYPLFPEQPLDRIKRSWVPQTNDNRKYVLKHTKKIDYTFGLNPTIIIPIQIESLKPYPARIQIRTATLSVIIRSPSGLVLKTTPPLTKEDLLNDMSMHHASLDLMASKYRNNFIYVTLLNPLYDMWIISWLYNGSQSSFLVFAFGVLSSALTDVLKDFVKYLLEKIKHKK